MCEKFGYKKITKEDKAKIFGLNAAQLYKVDVKAKRKALPADALDKLKTAYVDSGGSATTPPTAGSGPTTEQASETDDRCLSSVLAVAPQADHQNDGLSHVRREAAT